MQTAPILVLLVVASPVAAQPGAAPPTCSVTIARAPDEVRDVVEAWVRAEPRCASSLEVRIVPSDGGLYVLARDERGHVRERMVPDAQSAGVLIASWAADDAMPPEKTVVFVPAVTPPPATMPAAAGGGREDPDAEGGPPEAVTVASAGPERASTWISFGRLLDASDPLRGGLRAQVDLRTWGRWTLGIAASTSSTSTGASAFGIAGQLDTRDTKAVANIGRTMQDGRWSLRAAVGAGVVYTHAGSYRVSPPYVPSGYQFSDVTGVFGTAESSLVLGCTLGNWALDAGPVVSFYPQDLETTLQGMPVNMHRDALEVLLYTGLRRRL